MQNRGTGSVLDCRIELGLRGRNRAIVRQRLDCAICKQVRRVRAHSSESPEKLELLMRTMDFRHEFGSTLVAAEIPVACVAAILGHSSPVVTTWLRAGAYGCAGVRRCPAASVQR
jgi:hypothetical protein